MGGIRKRLPPDSDNAGDNERRTPQPAESPRCGNRPDPGRRGDERSYPKGRRTEG